VRICRHCGMFKTEQCTAVQNKGPMDLVLWSSLSVCPAWQPNERADYALQVLTYRKLSGYEEPVPEDPHGERE
jgi:hypothetical protein